MDPPDNDQLIEEACFGIKHFIQYTLHKCWVWSLIYRNNQLPSSDISIALYIWIKIPYFTGFSYISLILITK
jgi:hypothetical protein